MQRVLDRPDPIADPGSESRRSTRFRELAPVVLTALVGLIVGLGVTYVALHDDGPSTPAYLRGAPSVQSIERPAGGVASAPTADEILAGAAARNAAPFPSPAVEPASPRAALSAFLDAEAGDRSADSFALLDTASQRNAATVAAWRLSRADRVAPVRFEIIEEQRVAEDARLTVRAFRTPEISFSRGLVPAESIDTWTVSRRDSAGWRVQDGRETSSQPKLPSDALAVAAAKSWIDGAAACQPDIVDLQLAKNLLGTVALADTACKTGGAWRTAGAAPVADLPDVTSFVAAYGPAVGRWARGVQVTSGDGKESFSVVLGPVGQGWRVMGLTAAPSS